MKAKDLVEVAEKLPGGAEYYRCALQVNPFEYLRRHHKESVFSDEASYNQAIVDACKAHDITVIAVTDHYRIRSSQDLIKTARQADVTVFPGFEAVTKDGVHFLCLFNPETTIDTIERKIGDCGIHDESEASPTGKYDARELMEECRKWGAACIAAHVAGPGGLLKTLAGQSRIAAWTDRNLLACSLPGSVSDAPEELRPILENRNAEYRRARTAAVLNAQDVSRPEDLDRPGTSCWIKMSGISIEGLRQAFLDHESRIRLSSDPAPSRHSELVAMTWQGGFLDGLSIHFNENLNVLIGGRGTGKSTIVESMRYVLELEPLGDDARKSHEGIVRQVLQSGTKISLLVRVYHPSTKEFLIDRTVPNPAVVRDEAGNVLPLRPIDILPRAEVYGQHEISELAKNREKLTHLLERFLDVDPNFDKRKAEARGGLEKSRTRILSISRELAKLRERLDALPALEETLKRYREAGLEEKLKEQSLLVREAQVLKSAEQKLTPLRNILEEQSRALPLDVTFVSDKALAGLPGKDMLTELNTVFQTLNEKLLKAVTYADAALKEAATGIQSVKQRWDVRRQAVQSAYEKILRDLQKARIDGEEFLRLRREIEELRPLKEREAELKAAEFEAQQERRNILAQWDDLRTEEFQQFKKAANKVSKRLRGSVRVQVTPEGNRDGLFDLLRENVGGRLSETIEVLKTAPDLSLRKLAEACRTGRVELEGKYRLPTAQAERLSQMDPALSLKIEELDLPSTTQIELNVAPDGHQAEWRVLEELSTGQRATAVLLLLLLESEAPLIVDQPEDDLDNRFIADGVVPRMREEKRRRQFVFSTHNANIPVLGDAELILGLAAAGEASQGHAEVPQEHMGSIDSSAVRDLVEEILEGGKYAFETRRLKYGF